MNQPGMSRMGSGRTKLFAVLAVLFMVGSAFAFMNYGSSDISGNVQPQVSVEANVVYHSYETLPSTPSIGSSYNYGVYDSGETYYTYNDALKTYDEVGVNIESAFETYYVQMNGYYMKASSIGAIKSLTYYGTVISTEYNPQVWEFSGERWFAIKDYTIDSTYVFTGWKYATAGSIVDGVFTPSALTSVSYDPGDVLLYQKFATPTAAQITAGKDIYYSETSCCSRNRPRTRGPRD